MTEFNVFTATRSELQARIAELESRTDAVTQLAAENTDLKGALNKIAFTYPLSPHICGMTTIQTPATDRIVAGIKAEGVSLVKSAFEKHIQSPSCYQDEVIGMELALSVSRQVESQLREGAK